MNEINIEDIKKYFDTQPIEKAWLFGSYARGTQTSDSDIDLLVKFEPEARIGLITFSKIISELEEIAKKDVDLVVDGTFYPWVEERVSKEKILIYERVN
ncbi:MAG: nucleotidyltransferase domain-containing protein [Muribaculaceae bacterium]|nr:nucleotidyltransferase domain-containing protein [Muribaculaceae bacterium]